MKNLKKLSSIVLMFMMLGFNVVPLVSSAAQVDIRGNYNLNLTCVTGFVGCAGTVFPHVMNITNENLGTGVLSGTGHSVSDPTATWNLTGTISGATVTLHGLYTGTGAGYTFDLTGTRAGNGSISGTGFDSAEDTFTWVATNSHNDDDEDNNQNKVNICHQTGSQNHPWSAIQIDSSALQTHLGHGDFNYAGPLKQNGKPSNNGTEWCENHVPAPTATISATKIVCPTEDLLPNWGIGGADITSTTASTFVTNHPTCHTEPWNFEWAPEATANPGNNLGAAGGAWTPFTSTVSVPSGHKLWVREQMKPGYVPFSGATTNLNDTASKNSAEFYCNTDVLNYDNYDWIDPVQANHTYHCVGFNVPVVETPTTITVTATKIVCDSETSLPNWGTGENGAPFEITSSTATEWLGQHPTCHLQSGWDFQYGNQDTGAPADTLVGLAPGYTKFDQSTGEDGTTTMNIPITGVTEVHLAEVLKEGYIPFTAQDFPGNTNNVTAEIYCSSDIYNYDNYEGIGADEDTAVIVPGAHYYCLAWNALKTQPPVDVCPNLEGNQATVPEGMHLNNDGQCVPNDVPQCGDHELDVFSNAEDMVDGVNATPVASINPGWTANIPGATWIWSVIEGFDTTTSQTKTFAKTFNIVGTPTSATLDVAADNGYDVSINANSSVFSDPTEFNYNSVDSYNPLSFLAAGANTLAIAVTNMPVPESTFDSNPAGLLYKLHIVSNDCPPIDPTTGTLIVKKVLVNSEVDPSTFSFKVDGGDSVAFESDGENHITVIGGNHTVVENSYANYTTEYSTCTDLNVPAGGSATCTITNTYVPIVIDNAQCSDNSDNDEDGLIDQADPGCHSDGNVNNPDSYVPSDDNESNDSAVCSDGKDNDGDQLIDSNDPGCHAGGTFGGAYDPNDTDENNSGGGSGPTDNNGGGSGGGGKIAPQGQVLGASTSCGIYIDKFLRKGYKNDTEAVKKLQKFLNDYMKAGIKEDGNYGSTTEKAVKKFQSRQSGNVLNPWGFKGPTGIFYLTTQTEVNNIMCPDLKLPIPKLVPIEINPDAPKKK